MHPDLGGNTGPTPERLLANKYRSVDELERGYTELQRVSNESFTRLQTIEQKLAEMDRMNPAEQMAARRDPRELLEEVGVPPDAIAELVRAETEKFFQPMLRAQEAKTRLNQLYPDFQNIENDVAAFIKSNPVYTARYQRMYQADEEGAMDWATSTFLRETGAQPDTSRAEGALPLRGGGGPRSMENQLNQEQQEKLVERARQTGDWTQVVNQRLSLPDNFYDGQPRY